MHVSSVVMPLVLVVMVASRVLLSIGWFVLLVVVVVCWLVVVVVLGIGRVVWVWVYWVLVGGVGVVLWVLMPLRVWFMVWIPGLVRLLCIVLSVWVGV
jgi:hypothetical protein